jgi:hypothetical protein
MVTRRLAQEIARARILRSACLSFETATRRNRRLPISMGDLGRGHFFRLVHGPQAEKRTFEATASAASSAHRWSLLQRRVARAIITRAFGIVSAPLCDRWCANAR